MRDLIFILVINIFTRAPVCVMVHIILKREKKSAQVPSTSPRTHVTSHVAPPTYFCKPPCVWKYGGSSDSTAARPKFIAPVFTWKAMSKHANGALANEELGRRVRGKVPAGRVVCRRPLGVYRFGFTSLIELPSVRVLQGRNSARRQLDAEVWNWAEISPGKPRLKAFSSRCWRCFRRLFECASRLLLFFCYRRVRGDAWISNCCGLDVH